MKKQGAFIFPPLLGKRGDGAGFFREDYACLSNKKIIEKTIINDRITLFLMSHKSKDTDFQPRSSASERIKELEEELKKTKYNKRTQHHIGLVKAKIANLKERQATRKKSQKKGEGYSVRKTGDATVAILGFPSVGKSTLLNAITNAESATGAYDFTTLTVVPGLLEYNNAKIQVLDIPGIIQGAASGSGRGKEVIQVVRSADLVIILLDIFHLNHYKPIRKELYDAGIRIDKKKPYVKIKKTPRGGIRIGKTVRLDIEDETIKGILKEFRMNNADILIRDKIDEDELIDVIEGNKVYLPSLLAITKIDLADTALLRKAKALDPDVMVSAGKNIGTEELKQKIFQKLDFIRVCLKEIREKPDFKEPMIMKRGSTLADLCAKIHRDFIGRFRFARVWGKSAKFDGQMIRKLGHLLEDKDIVELHLK